MYDAAAAAAAASVVEVVAVAVSAEVVAVVVDRTGDFSAMLMPEDVLRAMTSS